MLYIICDQRHAVKHGLAMDWTKKNMDWTRQTWTQSRFL